MKDLKGQQFGRLTVSHVLGERKDRQQVWRCRCECGIYIDLVTSRLTSGNTKSCGCYRREWASQTNLKDLTGQRFGRLTVVAREGQTRRVKWKCLCDCGNTKVVFGCHLGRGTNSCGCIWREKVAHLRGASLTKEYHRKYKREHNATRAATKAQRTPQWSEIKAIRQFYAECPEGYHVDHIVPLRAKLVSGLHVLANLQYLPARENVKKRNTFAPEILCS